MQKRFRAEIFSWADTEFKKIITSKHNKESQLARDWNRALLQSAFPNDEAMWERLTPNYPPGCKRILFSDDYYPSLAAPNCNLDMRSIERITEKGIQVEGGEVVEYDLIIFATGFKGNQYFASRIDITGENGRPISDIWGELPQALYGVTIESLPNFGMLYGPNTNLNHSSIILMIEAESNYINGMIDEVLFAKKLGQSLAITPKKWRIDQYNDMIQQELAKMDFAEACGSWYKSKDGKKIVTNWSRSVMEYQNLLSKIDWSDFDLKGTATEVKRKGDQKKVGRVHEEVVLSNTAILGALGTVAVAGGLLLRSMGVLSKLKVR